MPFVCVTMATGPTSVAQVPHLRKRRAAMAATCAAARLVATFKRQQASYHSHLPLNLHPAGLQVLGRNVLVIWTKRIELKATCVLWICPAPNTEGVVLGAVEYQLVPAAGNGDTDVDNGADAYTLQPSSPSGIEAWQSALEAVSSHLPRGAPQLEQLVKEVGLDAGLMYITGLQETYQLVTNTAGQVLVLEPGESPDKLPPTPMGRVMCDLRAHLSIVHAKPSTVITLQDQTVPAVPVTQHIKVQRQEFEMYVPTHLSGRDVSVKISLTLGYDEHDAHITESPHGIHVYVNGMLIDLFFKVYPAMYLCYLPALQRPLMGVCVLEGVPDLPQAGFLTSEPCKHVKNQLNSWVAHYLAGQQTAAFAEGSMRSRHAGDNEPAAKRARLASQTSSRFSSLIGSQNALSAVLQPAEASIGGSVPSPTTSTPEQHAVSAGQQPRPEHPGTTHATSPAVGASAHVPAALQGFMGSMGSRSRTATNPNSLQCSPAGLIPNTSPQAVPSFDALTAASVASSIMVHAQLDKMRELVAQHAACSLAPLPAPGCTLPTAPTQLPASGLALLRASAQLPATSNTLSPASRQLRLPGLIQPTAPAQITVSGVTLGLGPSQLPVPGAEVQLHTQGSQARLHNQLLGSLKSTGKRLTDSMQQFQDGLDKLSVKAAGFRADTQVLKVSCNDLLAAILRGEADP